MKLTCSEESTPYDTVRLYRHAFNQFMSFIKFSSSAKKIHHTSVVLNFWNQAKVKTHFLKKPLSFGHQSGVTTSMKNCNKSDVVRFNAMFLHFFKEFQSFISTTVHSKPSHHGIPHTEVSISGFNE
ncbi:hypothetical protein TorRG33x02_249560 [Trema orientale]|uniref:Uncharacterized protein n=1 Tax=Trema orientale TaxID=63057 RepID=A0A2P5DJL4_TREOI|nr:hypothetical protein TorRG33x02_249560 [Trema orientale]